MRKCPVCGHKLYTNGKLSTCKFCGYTNNKDYLKHFNTLNNSNQKVSCHDFPN